MSRPEEFKERPAGERPDDHADSIAYDFFSDHQDRLDRQDRLAEIASLPFYGVQVDQPSERERRLHRQERDARLRLYPTTRRSGNVTPLGRKAA